MVDDVDEVDADEGLIVGVVPGALVVFCFFAAGFEEGGRHRSWIYASQCEAGHA